MAVRLWMYRPICPFLCGLYLEVTSWSISSNWQTPWNKLGMNCFPLSESSMFSGLYFQPQCSKIVWVTFTERMFLNCTTWTRLANRFAITIIYCSLRRLLRSFSKMSIATDYGGSITEKHFRELAFLQKQTQMLAHCTQFWTADVTFAAITGQQELCYRVTCIRLSPDCAANLLWWDMSRHLPQRVCSLSIYCSPDITGCWW